MYNLHQILYLSLIMVAVVDPSVCNVHVVHSFASFPPLARSEMCYTSPICGLARGGGDVVTIITSDSTSILAVVTTISSRLYCYQLTNFYSPVLWRLRS